MLRNCEITLKRDEVAALFDLRFDELAALSDAVAWHAHRKAAAPVDTADELVSLRALGELTGELSALVREGGAAAVRMTQQEARQAAQAVALYLAERDVESYQPPEERERIALLWPLSETLRELVIAVRCRPPARAGAAIGA